MTIGRRANTAERPARYEHRKVQWRHNALNNGGARFPDCARAFLLIRLHNQDRLIIASLARAGPLVNLIKQLATKVMGG